MPYTPFHDIDVYTKSQANAMEEMGIVDEKPMVRNMDNMKEYYKQEKGGVSQNSPLARSNFQLIDIWNKLQNANGVYEIPYKFSTTFAYPDLIMVSSELKLTNTQNLESNYRLCSLGSNPGPS